MVLSAKERKELNAFYAVARATLQRMINTTDYPRLRELYKKVLENLGHVPITFYGGEALSSSGGWATFGENLKRVSYFEGQARLQSAIRLPREHIFDELGNLRSNGSLTMLHELSHVVLTPNEEAFTMRVGLPGHYKDEFFADLLSARIGARMGISRQAIRDHLWHRRSYFGGFPIERFAEEGIKGLREEVREGRFVPRYRGVKREEPLFPVPRAREKPHILPRPKRLGEGPTIFPMPRRRI